MLRDRDIESIPGRVVDPLKAELLNLKSIKDSAQSVINGTSDQMPTTTLTDLKAKIKSLNKAEVLLGTLLAAARSMAG